MTHTQKQILLAAKPGQRGSTLLEAALVLPVWITLIMGIGDGGRAWFSYNILTYAVQQGARLASVRPALEQNDQVIIQRINQVLESGGLQASQAEITFTAPLRATRTIRIRAKLDFRPLVVSLWSSRVDFTIPMKAEFQTQYEL
ncbi:MAG: pilus assembly protein [Candidatus Omnitrophica bacterium]|nr:pilus assembly protein [Candidatus Omnitrophota bacterium]